jgi:hypothetical protein
MVPEINLTPQLESRFICALFGAAVGGGAAQRHDPPQRLKQLAGRAHRRCTHGAGHAHGGVCLHARN